MEGRAGGVSLCAVLKGNSLKFMHSHEKRFALEQFDNVQGKQC